MRVLVTRPEPASARTAAELERRGHEPVLLPLMQAMQQPEALASPPAPDAGFLAVTSAEAMRVLKTLPDNARRLFLALPLFAVGRATARQQERPVSRMYRLPTVTDTPSLDCSSRSRTKIRTHRSSI
ncbi:MAG: uroporphyrinogen-III synthase [Rhizobium sp.]|nr:uroporphyrinogen-III synthase [Rhizobium sp.]